jgi:DNA repair protein RadD
MELRPYQREALEKILWAKNSNLEGNDIVVLPTGAGKSIVIAHLANALEEPVLILQPNKEILEQNYSKLAQYTDPEDIGIYSASMNEKTIKHFTFATIGSIYKNAELFKHFKLVLIDECHLVNPKSLGGMFTKFLKEIGHPKVIGFTATPYRMDIGYRREAGTGFMGADELIAFTSTKLINRMKGFFWKRILFNIDVETLIQQGYLVHLDYVDQSIFEHADIPMNKSRSDFDMESYEELLLTRKEKIKASIGYALERYKSTIVFCTSVKQATEWHELTPGSLLVTAKTPAKERDQVIKDFKSGKNKIVFNVGVLTTGFDHPTLDCIILLRPTRSIGLYYQMLGRGVRIAEGKDKCTVIDLTSTVKNLGRVETIRLEKVENKWELISETGSWHNRELYSFKIEKK